MRQEPHWRTIEQGLHLGYYKGARVGTWIARRFYEGAYLKTRLGIADDTLDADGVAVLDFRQAQTSARTWFAELARNSAGLGPVHSGQYTVADALTDYLAWYHRNRKAEAATKAAANAHILPALGSRPVAKLTPRLLQDWLSKLAEAPARRRSRLGGDSTASRAVAGHDAKRKRKATANRVLTVLKAALNHAWRDGKVSSDEAWRRVTPFRDVDAPVVRYLSEAECARLVNGSPADFQSMVRAALLTGCRYGELLSLRVSDFNPDAGTVSIRTSKSGKPRHAVLADEGRTFFKTTVAGRTGADLMFARADGSPWNKNHQQRRLATACKRAGIKPAVSFHVLRHTYGSLLAMKGVPMAVIAEQLGHSDTRMTERHYAHLGPSYVAETIRANFPALGILEASKVTAMPTLRKRK